MNKKFVLPILMSTLLLVGCSGNKPVTPVDPTEDPTTERVKNQTVTFYLDYWHSETPLYEMEWYSNTPLGECPVPCRLTSADASDPLFSKFLGWSQYSSSIDDSHIWDFAKDTKGGIELNLYGIWVAEE